MSGVARAILILVIATVLLVSFVVATLAGTLVLVLLWVMRAAHSGRHG